LLQKKGLLSVVALTAIIFGYAVWSRSADRTVPANADPVEVAEAAWRASRKGGMATPLPLEENAEIRRYLVKYTEGVGRKTTVKGFEQAGSKVVVAERIFAEEGVPAELVWLAQVESLWRIRAVSPAAAAGVWQFIPKTAVRFGLHVDESRDDRYDFEKQTRIAARYLRFLYDYYDGNWELAIGAYNTGEENMDRAIARSGGVRNFWVLSERGLLHPETREYVPKVLAASIVGTDPDRFGLGGVAPRSTARSSKG
jgi:membrane-bound lytic murein transglycosylase D